MKELKMWIEEDGSYKWKASDGIMINEVITMGCILIHDGMEQFDKESEKNDTEGEGTEEEGT